MNEAGSGALNGAIQGGMSGAMTGNPWAALGGAVLGGVGGYMSGQSKKKSAQEYIKQLQKALQSMNTTDAFGNNLSYKGGTWQYNLSNAGRNAKNAASNAIANAGSYQNKSRAEIARDTMNKNYLSNMLTARANQAAAMRSGARTNSNLGNISNSYARLGSQNLRNDYKQGFNDAKNSALYNANIRNALAQAANSSLQPINSMQGNLLQMITGLSGIQMNQLNNIAQAKANSYLNGQDVADLIKGLGGMVSAYSQNQQEQDNFDKLIAALSSQEKKNNALF